MYAFIIIASGVFIQSELSWLGAFKFIRATTSRLNVRVSHGTGNGLNRHRRKYKKRLKLGSNLSRFEHSICALRLLADRCGATCASDKVEIDLFLREKPLWSSNRCQVAHGATDESAG